MVVLIAIQLVIVAWLLLHFPSCATPLACTFFFRMSSVLSVGFVLLGMRAVMGRDEWRALGSRVRAAVRAAARSISTEEVAGVQHGSPDAGAGGER